MIYTMDKSNQKVNKYFISLIPLNKNEEIYNNGLKSNVLKLDVLSYKKASNYRNMSDEEIINYIEKYYNDVLSKLDPETLARELRYSIFVSDERCDSLALRHIVSEWLSIYTNEKIVEINIDKDGKFIKLDRPSFIKPILEDVIKNSKKTMRGFNSLKALYLFEKGEILEEKADILEEKTGENFDHLRQAACFLRCDADMAEEEYNKNNYYDISLNKEYRKEIKGQIRWKL